MVLDEAQKESVKKWIETGWGLSEIQKGLAEEFGIRMTYMDVRFLLIDMNLSLKEKNVRPRSEEAPKPADDIQPPSPLPDGVSVGIDRIVKPGALVSGSVTFSDGRSGTWSLDQLGRLALDMGDPDYRPGEKDIADFQTALRNALQKKGF